MLCPSCGKEIPNSSRFCLHCGASISTPPATPHVPARLPLRKHRQQPRRVLPTRTRLLATLAGHTESVYSVAFSVDGKTLASGAHDDTVKLWDVQAMSLIRTLPVGEAVHSVAFSPDGKTLAAAYGLSHARGVALWDTHTWLERRHLPHNTLVNWVVFSPDGSMLATVTHSVIRLWDARTWDLKVTISSQGLYQPNEYSFSAAAFSPDGKSLAGAYTSPQNGMLAFWDTQTGTKQQELNMLGGILSPPILLPDGDTVAISTGQWIKVEYMPTRTQLRWLRHYASVHALAISRNGMTLASGDWSGKVILWDVQTGKSRQELTGHTGAVHSLAFSPDDKTLASGASDKMVKLWQIG